MAAPTIPYTIPGTVNQSRPELVARLSFASARTPEPLTWVDVSSRMRSFSIERGAENELDLIDTGTATVVLDNRDRALDPFNTSSPYSPNVKPRRRLWLQSQWDGQTIDQFYGWTDAFKPEWTPNVPGEAVVSLTARDGFAILAGDALPTTSPPRDSYTDVIMFDKPTVYLKLEETAGPETADSSEQATAGLYVGTYTYQLSSLVTGDATGKAVSINPSGFDAEYINFDGRGRAAISSLTFEMILNIVDLGTGGTTFLAIGPDSSVALGTPCWSVAFSTTNLTMGFTASNNTQSTATWAHVFAAGDTAHVIAVWNGTTIKLYVNDVEQATATPSAGMASGGGAAPTRLRFLRSQDSSGPQIKADEISYYERVAMSAARRTAHYNAARNRGRPQEFANNRIAALLEESGLPFVPRRLRTAARQVQPIYYTGQAPKGELEAACMAEGDPSICFFAKDGAIVFLDRAHRTVSPWNTVQATFDDDGTDLPYRNLEIDDGEAFIFNDVRLAALGGELQQSTDTASIAEYQRRVLDRGETLNINDTDADAEADALLAKYKDPLARITALELTGGNPDVLTAFLIREIGDSIRVFRRPVGGGSAIDQTSFIRKISLSGDATSDIYWTCKWAVAKR